MYYSGLTFNSSTYKIFTFGLLNLIICILTILTSPSHLLGQTLSTADNAFDDGVFNQGWYSNDVDNEDSNTNYNVGTVYPYGDSTPITYRNFFTFYIPQLTGEVQSATLVLKRFLAGGSGPSAVDFGLFDVSTNASELNNNSGQDSSIYNDLGSGTSYGQYNVNRGGDSAELLYFNLNSNALDAINSVNEDFFSIGGAILTPLTPLQVTSLFSGSTDYAASLVLTFEASSNLAQFGIYDDFNAKRFGEVRKAIDTSKWSGSEYGNYIGEIERKIKAKRMFFKLRSWGNGTEDSGATIGRNGLIFKEDVGSIAGVCFTPRIKKYENNTCSTNSMSSAVGFEYWGTMYDSNTQNDSENGIVYAYFRFGRSTDADDAGVKKHKFFAFAGAYQCADDTCNTLGWSTWNTGSTDPNLWFGEFSKENKTEFCVRYDSTSNQLIYSAGDDTRSVDITNNGLPPEVADVHPSRVWHTLEAGVDVANCQTDGMLPGYLEGYIDNVKVWELP